METPHPRPWCRDLMLSGLPLHSHPLLLLADRAVAMAAGIDEGVARADCPTQPELLIHYHAWRENLHDSDSRGRMSFFEIPWSLWGDAPRKGSEL